MEIWFPTAPTATRDVFFVWGILLINSNGLRLLLLPSSYVLLLRISFEDSSLEDTRRRFSLTWLGKTFSKWLLASGPTLQYIITNETLKEGTLPMIDHTKLENCNWQSYMVLLRKTQTQVRLDRTGTAIQRRTLECWERRDRGIVSLTPFTTDTEMGALCPARRLQQLSGRNGLFGLTFQGCCIGSVWYDLA